MFDKNIEEREQLPAIALSDIVPLPGNEIRIDVNNDSDIKALKVAEQYRNYLVVLFTLKGKDDFDTPKIDRYYQMGILSKVVLHMTNPNGSHRIKIQPIVRCHVNEFTLTNPNLMVDFTTCPSYTEDENKELATLELIKQELVSFNIHS